MCSWDSNICPGLGLGSLFYSQTNYGTLPAAEAPLMLTAGRISRPAPCEIPALFTLGPVAGFPTSVVYCLLAPVQSGPVRPCYLLGFLALPYA